MVNQPKNLSIILICLLVGGILGFAFGRMNRSVPNYPIQPKSSQIQTNPLFKSQTATFEGEITKVEGNSLIVKDEKGQTGNLPISSKVVIYKFKPGSSLASASSDLKLIDPGKKAQVVLELIDGKYQVVSISYLP